MEEYLLSSPAFATAIVDCFVHSKADSFENLLEPLQKLLRLSPAVAATLAHPELLSRTVQKVQSKKAVVRLNLLRITRSICDATDQDGNLITTCGLYDAINDLAKNDQAILVRELASDLIKSSELNARRSMEGVRRNLRRSSSTTMTPTPLPSSSSVPPTPSSEMRGLRSGSYFDYHDSNSTARQILRPLTTTSSPYRSDSQGSDVLSPSIGPDTPVLNSPSILSQPGHVHQHSTSSVSLPVRDQPQKSRLPRTRTAQNRLSLVPVRVDSTSLPNSAGLINGNVFSPFEAGEYDSTGMRSSLSRQNSGTSVTTSRR